VQALVISGRPPPTVHILQGYSAEDKWILPSTKVLINSSFSLINSLFANFNSRQKEEIHPHKKHTREETRFKPAVPSATPFSINYRIRVKSTQKQTIRYCIRIFPFAIKA
jgi:hypothetical protein